MSTTRIAVVTGASQGIGKDISLRLAHDGFDLALNDLPSARENLEILKQEITSLGRKADIFVANVSVESEVANMISQIAEKMGGVDVMVANAGICITKNFTDITTNDWNRIFSINCAGVFLCYQFAAKQMIKQGRGGRIIGASSLAGQQGKAGLSAYSATKFAVRGLTQSVASELGPYGITVNAYAPGAIETTMLQSIGESRGSVEKTYDVFKNDTPVGRLGTPKDVSAVVSFLASEEASFITGQSLSVNGGMLYD